MTNDNIPELLKQCIDLNEPSIDIIANKLKLPWLKLNLNFSGTLDNDYVQQLQAEDTSWRAIWQTDFDHIKYQVNGWNGSFLFGPENFLDFLSAVSDNKEFFENSYDEDCQCKFFRKNFNFEWKVNPQDQIRKWVSDLIPDCDLNIVNTYVLPPQGYVYPHRDYSYHGSGLAKIYIPVQWEAGSVFGMYGVGNMPLSNGDAFLINNYSLPHWVYNGSDSHRVVISIGANLESPKLSRLIKESFVNLFGITQ